MTGQTTQYHYKYTTTPISTKPPKVDLPCEKNANHGDHWAILTDDITNVADWFQQTLDTAKVPTGLTASTTQDDKLLIAQDTTCHIKQIFSLENGRPTEFINAYPSVDSPYGVHCMIERVICCEHTSDAILRLSTKDGTTLYAFDQLYAINQHHYQTNKQYYANFSAWAYNIEPSDQSETILVDDPKAIRYHRAFNDIVSANGGQVPKDIDDKIRAWQPDDPNSVLAPVEINFGHSCIYLFGETFGQEDEAWCQGQVFGIHRTRFFDKELMLFDVVILREPDSEPLVVRIATPTTAENQKIAVHDYVQANIWLQVAIYGENQK
ncbi:hypothetical protein [Moraxella oblonga]|uniref:hypothetical protein n=1 Tax=Moraxella oblonga TaxID=200413 RepID=UPI00082E0E30|nr:hypothetical protein [Moraxella oblonga]